MFCFSCGVAFTTWHLKILLHYWSKFQLLWNSCSKFKFCWIVRSNWRVQLFKKLTEVILVKLESEKIVYQLKQRSYLMGVERLRRSLSQDLSRNSKKNFSKLIKKFSQIDKSWIKTLQVLFLLLQWQQKTSSFLFGCQLSANQDCQRIFQRIVFEGTFKRNEQ